MAFYGRNVGEWQIVQLCLVITAMSEVKVEEITVITKRWEADRNKRLISGSFLSVLVVGLFHAVSHEAGEQRQHHLWIHFHHIVRQSVDAGSDLTGQRDRVPGIKNRKIKVKQQT